LTAVREALIVFEQSVSVGRCICYETSMEDLADNSEPKVPPNEQIDQ